MSATKNLPQVRKFADFTDLNTYLQQSHSVIQDVLNDYNLYVRGKFDSKTGHTHTGTKHNAPNIPAGAVVLNAEEDGTVRIANPSALNFTTGIDVASTGGKAVISVDISELQVASAAQLGILSAADWSTFNNKENILTFTDPIHRSGSTIAVQTGYVIPTTTEETNWNTAYGWGNFKVISGIAATGGLTQYDVVYKNVNSGEFAKASATNEITAPAKGIATANIAEGIAGDILVTGEMTNVAWNWTPRAEIFLSETSGQLTQTCPVGAGKVVQIVGYSKNATTIVFRFNNVRIILA